ncbi:MAG: J domain-containing protein [Oscillospiraceae bacterium]|nr:J domain-containing protein [Oscillospiraceae bacterium]
MKDPYEVLGISRNATDSEVKSAYRKLAKKYHPDNYNNSPLASVAEEKMKEINEAYDAINNERKGKGQANGANGGYAGANYARSTEYINVRRLIQLNRIEEAERILDGVELNSRSAEWYFLRGMCYYRKGWTQQASSHFQTACNMEPNNQEYRSAVYNMNNQGNYGYGGYNTTAAQGSQCTVCDICTAIWCADCCCDCARGC